jgi:hypothetical protein
MNVASHDYFSFATTMHGKSPFVNKGDVFTRLQELSPMSQSGENSTYTMVQKLGAKRIVIMSEQS